MKKLFNTLKKSYQFLTGVYQVSKNWIVENGITGVAGLILGLILWSFGYKIWAGFSFGIFATRNWDILKNWFLKKYFNKINKK
jgi:predicted small integral membrane protein